MEHPASTCIGEGFLRKLLAKAKKGTTEPYFAADIAEGNLQTSMLTMAKLGFPAAFMEHHGKNLTENIILEDHDGHKWPVLLGRYWDSKPCFLQGKAWNSKPCLLQGWGEFAADCNLAVNDQILLYLWEDSHFIVHVFDSNLEIKYKRGGTSAHIARTTLLQVTDPIESFGFKTTTPNISSLPSTNNNSGVAKNVHKENHTTQASPSGEKLGNQEPGVEEDDDRVADFNAKSGEMVESFQSAPTSDAEEDQALSMERARILNRNITLDDLTRLGVQEFYGSVSDPPRGALSVLDSYLKADFSVQETARSTVRKGKEPKFIEEIIPKKRARQAPTDRSQTVSASTSRTRQARGMRTSPDDSDDADTRATMSAPPPWQRLSHRMYGGAVGIAGDAAFAARTAKAREAAEAAANKEGDATARAPAPAPVPAPVPASDPVTPLQVEAPKQAFKRPQPRNPPRHHQLFFSKRRPVTQQERQAALDAGQRYAVASYNRTHVMQLRFSQVYCGYILGGTADFAKAMELPLQGKKQVILYDMTGRQWPALWRGEHPKRTGLDSSAWTSFVLEHYLEEDDVCVFELPDPKVSNISVTVFPVVPVTPTPSGWKNHYSVDEPVVPAVVPAVVQPEADVGLVQATLGQSSSFEKEDSGMEGQRRRLSIDLNEQILREGQEQ